MKGKKVNKLLNTSQISDKYIHTSSAGRYIALSIYTEVTPDPPQQVTTPLSVLKARKRLRKKPTQKHVRHTLRLLAQQEAAFLDRSIVRAENEATELAKQDKHNKQRISIDSNHRVNQADHSWRGTTKQAWNQAQSNLKCITKQLKRTGSTSKTVRFAPTRSVQRFFTDSKQLQ